MKPQYGYCAVTADFLHIGHIEFLKACKDKCENLIVGIMADECVGIYKGKKPLMNQLQREEMVKSLKFVHKTIIQTEFDFPHYVFRLKEFYGKDFIIIDSDEHKHKRSADIIIEGGIIRKHSLSSSSYKNYIGSPLGSDMVNGL